MDLVVGRVGEGGPCARMPPGVAKPQPALRQRFERFELRPTTKGHRAEDNLKRLTSFSTVGVCKLRSEVHSYSQVQDAVRTPPADERFGALRAALISREVGHALPSVVRDGDAFDICNMPSVDEHRSALNLKGAGRNEARDAVELHLSSVDEMAAEMSDRHGAELPLRPRTYVQQVIDPGRVTVDAEPIMCEGMRELRDLYAVAVEGVDRSSACLGRTLVTDPSFVACKELDVLYRSTHKTLDLRLDASEQKAVRNMLDAVFAELLATLRSATPLVASVLRRDKKKAARKKARAKRKKVA
jgi:hypothetical protein